MGNGVAESAVACARADSSAITKAVEGPAAQRTDGVLVQEGEVEDVEEL